MTFELMLADGTPPFAACLITPQFINQTIKDDSQHIFSQEVNMRVSLNLIEKSTRCSDCEHLKKGMFCVLYQCKTNDIYPQYCGAFERREKVKMKIKNVSRYEEEVGKYRWVCISSEGLAKQMFLSGFDEETPIYICCTYKGFDSEYIRKIINKAKIVRFDNKTRAICQLWFCHTENKKLFFDGVREVKRDTFNKCFSLKEIWFGTSANCDCDFVDSCGVPTVYFPEVQNEHTRSYIKEHYMQEQKVVIDGCDYNVNTVEQEVFVSVG